VREQNPRIDVPEPRDAFAQQPAEGHAAAAASSPSWASCSA
jgi:hypothetical protein